MSKSMRTHFKLFSNLYNKSSNICLFGFKIELNNNLLSNNKHLMYYSIGFRSLSSNRNLNPKTNALSETQNSSQTELTIGEKVKQTTQDISYFGVILIGVSVTAVILYAVFRELFSSVSPNVIYSNALKLCKSDPRVIEAIGQPIKGFGEMTSRGRRRHVSHLEYEKDGQQVIRVKFYLKGPKTGATVHLEAYKSGTGPQFRYLFVELDNSRNVIVLEDNRRIASIV